jgi:hypothetical protein
MPSSSTSGNATGSGEMGHTEIAGTGLASGRGRELVKGELASGPR